jgi:hypothetical protein
VGIKSPENENVLQVVLSVVFTLHQLGSFPRACFDDTFEWFGVAKEGKNLMIIEDKQVLALALLCPKYSHALV